MVFEIIATGLAIIILFLLAGMAFWVYRDAKRTETRYALVWAVLTFVGGLFGLAAYLAVSRFDLLEELEASRTP